MPPTLMPPVDFADTELLSTREGHDGLTGRDVARVAETYSSAIVAFTVFQALTYSYVFGTNPLFNCLIKSEPYLGAALVLLFVVVLALMFGVMRFLGELIQSVAGRFRDSMRRLYRAKLVAVVVFTLLPLMLTLVYGVLLRRPDLQCRLGAEIPVGTSAVVEPRPVKPSDLPGTP